MFLCLVWVCVGAMDVYIFPIHKKKNTTISPDIYYSRRILVSFFSFKIYNEMIRDLLNPSSGFLDLREDSKGVIQVAGITEVSTINAQEVRRAAPTLPPRRTAHLL